MATYRVLRQHEGDRLYLEGETREVDAAEVAHLERLGVLEKMEDAPSDKSEPAPANKAEGRRGKSVKSED